MIAILTSIFVSMSLVSCGPRLKGINVLTTPPLDNTIHSCYPSIKTIYQSDDEIILVSMWSSTGESKNHRIRWEIYNQADERIYTAKEQYVTIRRYMSNYQHILLDNDLKAKLQLGTCTVKLYFDDKLVKYQDIKYINESLINANLNGAVILPFRFKASSYVQEKVALNTVTNAIYGEVRRIIKDTVPPSAAEEEIPYKFHPKLFSDEEKMARIKEIFPENIFLSGTLELKQYKHERMALIVSVYDARKGYTRKFGYQTSASENYETIMIDLIDGVLYRKGLLEYLRSLTVDLQTGKVFEVETKPSGLDKERKRFAEEPKPSREEAKLADIPKNMSGMRVSLRTESKKLLERDIRKMLARYGFYDDDLNWRGSFTNDFVDNGNGTITDNATGLMWQKSGSSRAKTLKRAKTYVKQLNMAQFAGYSDWRLPTIEEFVSLVDREKVNGVHIDPLFDNKQKICWSSDKADPFGGHTANPPQIWIVNFAKGGITTAIMYSEILSIYSTSEYNYVRAVRGVK
jgi:hypothetical protein